MINSPAIYKAIEKCDLTKVDQLLHDEPELVYSRNDENLTLLHVAAEKDSIGPQTDYHRESGERYLKIAKLLIFYSADVNATCNDGRTPLHIAVTQGHFDMAALLLSNGANPNVKDKYGYTPMHVVYEEILVLEGHLQMITLLLLFGADVSIKDNNGDDPLGIFKRNENFEAIDFVASYLKNRQAKSR